MSMIATTRRAFLKGACILSGGLLLSVRMANKAYAGIKGIKDYMNDRINSVYRNDSTFPKRASQDNAQVQAMYADFFGKPLSHKSEEMLHTKWFDKSAGIKALKKAGVYPSPRMKEFSGNKYLYEE